MLADFCGKAEFTSDDVEERGFRRDNFSAKREEERVWLALAGKKPAKPLYQQTVNEWIEIKFVILASTRGPSAPRQAGRWRVNR
jgi:hypothetical protein